MQTADAAEIRDPVGLGRRITLRRDELDLTRAQLAHRVSTSTSYVQAVEEGRASGLTPDGVMRFAAALETTTGDLLGHGIDRPPGRRGPGTDPRLETLSEAECFRLLDPGGIGRVVFSADGRPVAPPVNYRILDGEIVFRTAPDTILAAVPTADAVSFEIDRIDDAMSEGWSVLASGRLEHIADLADLRRLGAQGIAPWAGDGRDVYVRLAPTEVSGRRIRSGESTTD